MSVASTKAFYSQVAAGLLLAAGPRRAPRVSRRASLRSAAARPAGPARGDGAGSRPSGRTIAAAASAACALPASLGRRRQAAPIASPPRRSGSSSRSSATTRSPATARRTRSTSTSPPNRWCSSAPPGCSGATADDVAKEVAIFAAHKAAPIVVADRGEQARFAVASHVIAVPAVAPELAFVLSAMVGHLFGYEAALAIDAHARPLREARSAIETLADGQWESPETPCCARSGQRSSRFAAQFFARLRAGAYNGNLEASTAVARGVAVAVRDRRRCRSRGTSSNTTRVGTPERDRRGPRRGADRRPSAS